MLESSYTAADRFYHDLVHIEDCLNQFDQVNGLAREPRQMELAIWFHDVVYDTRAKDNEERSALAAEAFLEGMEIAERVGALIRATQHTTSLDDPEAVLLCDIDLSILGRDSATYDRYAQHVRREYQWVLLPDFIAGRCKVLQSFLERDQIFRTMHFRERYEAQARLNLQRELDRLPDMSEG